jgi:Ca2+-transporting ATPase
MGCLFGFIVTFLGSSILNSLGGVPFLPLQTLWINFTTLLFQAIGLGYGQPSDGLMQQPPRPPDRPILTRGLLIWLITAGVIMGAGTLGVITWAEHTYTDTVAHTMGMVTFSLFTLFFSIATKDTRRTAFTLDTLSDKTFVRATAISVLTLIAATVLGPLQALLDTTSLTFQQWLTCAGLGATILVASEIWKAVSRRMSPSTISTTSSSDRRTQDR